MKSEWEDYDDYILDTILKIIRERWYLNVSLVQTSDAATDPSTAKEAISIWTIFVYRNL